VSCLLIQSIGKVIATFSAPNRSSLRLNNMVSRKRTDSAINTLRMIPTKWAIVLVVLLIGYVLLQPRINQWLGWNLPSVASLVGDEKPTTKKEPKPTKEVVSKEKTSEKVSGNVAEKTSEKKSEVAQATTTKTANRTSDSGPKDSAPKDSAPKDSADDRIHGILKDLGRNRFESPEGLVYGPGSEEGHRLKHIERHLEDQPSRPGPHGVFDGDMKEFLVAIDRAFAMANKGAKGSSKKEDEGAVVYEATFEKPIGFLGGSDGKRRKNPALKKMRVVVRGKSVITAFPVQ
jgi:hypothetical protein